MKYPNTTFLTCENATSDLINHLAIKILFTNSRKLATISNSQKLEKDIYKSMLLVITENRLVLLIYSKLNFPLLYLFIFKSKLNSIKFTIIFSTKYQYFLNPKYNTSVTLQVPNKGFLIHIHNCLPILLI